MVDAKALRAFVIIWRGGSNPLSDTSNVIIIFDIYGV